MAAWSPLILGSWCTPSSQVRLAPCQHVGLPALQVGAVCHQTGLGQAGSVPLRGASSAPAGSCTWRHGAWCDGTRTGSCGGLHAIRLDGLCAFMCGSPLECWKPHEGTQSQPSQMARSSHLQCWGLCAAARASPFWPEGSCQLAKLGWLCANTVAPGIQLEPCAMGGLCLPRAISVPRTCCLLLPMAGAVHHGGVGEACGGGAPTPNNTQSPSHRPPPKKSLSDPPAEIIAYPYCMTFCPS